MSPINFNAKQTPLKSASILGSTSLELKSLWRRLACIYMLQSTTSVILLPLSLTLQTNVVFPPPPLEEEECSKVLCAWILGG